MKIENEGDFKRWFKKHWSGWIESYEPARGGGVGIPDLQVLISLSGGKESSLLPIELKVGEIRNKVLFPREVRPAQIGWHKRFADAGGKSLLVTGVLDGTTFVGAYATNCRILKDWEFGFTQKECVRLDEDNLSSGLVKALWI